MTSGLAQMIADAADVVAPEMDPEYPEIPEWAWDYTADPSREGCQTCWPYECSMD